MRWGCLRGYFLLLILASLNLLGASGWSADFSVHAEAAPGGRTVARLTLAEGRTLVAIFTPQGRPARVYFTGVADRRQMMIRASEQRQMKIFLEENGASFHASEPDAFKLLDLAANFLPADEVVEPFENLQFWREPIQKLDWTPICDRIGQVMSARFTVNGISIESAAVVGDRATRCRGRCGASCQQFGQLFKSQYTQECFDHDVCRDSTKQNLGECADEFWKAAVGYVLAGNCF